MSQPYTSDKLESSEYGATTDLHTFLLFVQEKNEARLISIPLTDYLGNRPVPPQRVQGIDLS